MGQTLLSSVPSAVPFYMALGFSAAESRGGGEWADTVMMQRSSWEPFDAAIGSMSSARMTEDSKPRSRAKGTRATSTPNARMITRATNIFNIL